MWYLLFPTWVLGLLNKQRQIKEKPVCAELCFCNTELSALISKDPETTMHCDNLSKTMPNWVMVYEKLGTLHELNSLEKHVKKLISVWLYQSLHYIVVEEIWSTLVYNVGSVHCLCTALLRPTTAFIHNMVWTSTGPLQHFDSFLFFSHSVSDFLVCLGSLSCCRTQFQKSSRLLQWLQDTQRYHCKTKQADQMNFLFCFVVYLQFLHVNLLGHQTLGQWFWILSACE